MRPYCRLAPVKPLVFTSLTTLLLLATATALMENELQQQIDKAKYYNELAERNRDKYLTADGLKFLLSCKIAELASRPQNVKEAAIYNKLIELHAKLSGYLKADVSISLPESFVKRIEEQENG